MLTRENEPHAALPPPADALPGRLPSLRPGMIAAMAPRNGIASDLPGRRTACGRDLPSPDPRPWKRPPRSDSRRKPVEIEQAPRPCCVDDVPVTVEIPAGPDARPRRWRMQPVATGRTHMAAVASEFGAIVTCRDNTEARLQRLGQSAALRKAAREPVACRHWKWQTGVEVPDARRRIEPNAVVIPPRNAVITGGSLFSDRTGATGAGHEDNLHQVGALKRLGAKPPDILFTVERLIVKRQNSSRMTSRIQPVLRMPAAMALIERSSGSSHCLRSSSLWSTR